MIWTLSQVYTDMVASVPRRANTTKAYDSSWRNHLEPVFGNLTIIDGELNGWTFKSFAEFLRDKQETLSPRTIALMRATLNTIFNHAIEMDLLMDNPLRGRRVQGLKGPMPREYVSLDVDKLILELRSKAMYRHALAVVLAAKVGMRRSEIRAFRWDNVDPSLLSIQVFEQVTHNSIEPVKSTASVRDVVISKATYETLVKLSGRKQLMKNWPFKTGKGFVSMSRLLNQIRTHCPDYPKFGWHDLRHQYATTCRDKGIPAEALQKQLGHAKLTTTLGIYSHVTPKQEHLP